MYMDAQIEMSSSEGYQRRKQYTKTNWMKLYKGIGHRVEAIHQRSFSLCFVNLQREVRS